MAHTNHPPIVPALSAPDGAKAAGTGAEQSGFNSVAHRRSDAVERVAFADAPQVDLNAGSLETNRARFAIGQQLLASDQRLRRFDFIGFRDAALPSQETPAAAQRAGGNVERAFGLAVKLLTQRQQREQRRLDVNFARRGVPVDETYFAVFSEDG